MSNSFSNWQNTGYWFLVGILFLFCWFLNIRNRIMSGTRYSNPRQHAYFQPEMFGFGSITVAAWSSHCVVVLQIEPEEMLRQPWQPFVRGGRSLCSHLPSQSAPESSCSWHRSAMAVLLGHVCASETGAHARRYRPLLTYRCEVHSSRVSLRGGKDLALHLPWWWSERSQASSLLWK